MAMDVEPDRRSGPLAALRAVAANRDLRLLQSAWLLANIGDFAYFLAVAVFAYDAGGAAGVGIAAVARAVPAALAAPYGSALADRHPRRLVMVGSDLLRALALTGSGVGMLLGAPPAVVIGFAALAAVVTTPFEPAKAALLPDLAREPEELTAANLVSSTIESVTLFVGPAIGAAVIAASEPGVAMLVSVATLVASAALVAGIRGERNRSEVAGEEEDGGGIMAGFRVVRADPALALLITVMAVNTFVYGALTVLMTVLAFDLLDTGETGLGYLNSAVGVGALVGAGVTLGLVGSRRLGLGVAGGLALWGLPIALAGLVTDPVVALVAMGILGVGNTLLDVSTLTLTQRIAPEEVMARVFGVQELLIVITVAAGSLVAPGLLELLGNEAAFVAIGLVMPLLALVALPRLRAIDARVPAPGREVELLGGVPLFAPLGPVELEQLAARLRRRELPAGAAIVTQGEPGEEFYVVGAGEVRVAVDGREVRTEGPGAHFGEIALLRDVPRTATVTSVGDVELYVLGREDFLGAVTGHSESAAAAETVVAARLARARPAGFA